MTTLLSYPTGGYLKLPKPANLADRERSPVWARLEKLTRGDEVASGRSTSSINGADEGEPSEPRANDGSCSGYARLPGKTLHPGLAFKANGIGSALVCSSGSTHPLHCEPTAESLVSTALRRRPNAPQHPAPNGTATAE
ncbi:hypothetical protein QR685DRAFT_569169 [Neurospora intermedia]|uniref:Uncharacterized protein n=1 Tax=Neurospora intermedia TaxID=5142 RepID=A0ABR3DL13_NEUIN